MIKKPFLVLTALALGISSAITPVTATILCLALRQC